MFNVFASFWFTRFELVWNFGLVGWNVSIFDYLHGADFLAVWCGFLLKAGAPCLLLCHALQPGLLLCGIPDNVWLFKIPRNHVSFLHQKTLNILLSDFCSCVVVYVIFNSVSFLNQISQRYMEFITEKPDCKACWENQWGTPASVKMCTSYQLNLHHMKLKDE